MNFQSAKPMMERLKVLEDTTEMQKGENRIADINSIVFKNVSFQYVDDHENVIKNISYEFLKGKKYLIVGKSGCGKSTFLRLIAKCFSSYEGEILVNGKEQKEYLESDLYKLIGFMTQNIFLLNDSLKQNLTLYEEYEEKDIRASLKQAGFDNPDKIFKDGLETQISEAGNNFSGGEKQRIALARLLLHKFSWLLFDEFTSNLDAKVADTIESQLLNIHDATVITVSHRLNKKMMQSYDEIIVMDDGEIVEFGSYDSLMQKRGQFYTLAIRNNV
jgi:ATP-binding cassette subfamily C protein